MASCCACGKGFLFLSKQLTDGFCCFECWDKYANYQHGREFKGSYSVSYIKKCKLLFENEPEADKRARNHWMTTYNSWYNKFDVYAPSVDDFFYVVNKGVLGIIEICPHYLAKYNWAKLLDGTNTQTFPLKQVEEYVIPVKDILCYAKDGDIQYTTEISGGGGGGSNLAGAIIGGIIAGDAGAIIGSRQATESITSTTTTHDSRNTILRYYKDGNLCTAVFNGFGLYDFLLKEIPDKDLLAVQLQQNAQQSNSNSADTSPKASDDIKEKLKTLKGLYEDGLIDEAEYNEKKKELLQQL